MLVTCASCKKPVFVSASMVAGGSASVTCQSCGTGLEVSPDGAVNVPGGPPADAEAAPETENATETETETALGTETATGTETEPELESSEPIAAQPEPVAAPEPPTPQPSSPGYDMPVPGVVAAAESTGMSPLPPIAPPPQLQPLGVPPAPPPDFGDSTPTPAGDAAPVAASLEGPVPPPPPIPTLGVAQPTVEAPPTEPPPAEALPAEAPPPMPTAASDDSAVVHSDSFRDQEVVTHTYGPERSAVDAVDIATSLPPGGGFGDAQGATDSGNETGILSEESFEELGDGEAMSADDASSEFAELPPPPNVSADGGDDAREAAEALLVGDAPAYSQDAPSPFAPPPEPQPPVEPAAVADMVTNADVGSTGADAETWQATEPAATQVPGTESPWNSGTPAQGIQAPGGAWSEPARASVAEHVPGLEGAPYDPVPWSGPRPRMPDEISSKKSRRAVRSTSMLPYIGGGAAMLLIIILAFVFIPGGEDEPEPKDDGRQVAAANPATDVGAPDADDDSGEVDFGELDAPDIDMDSKLPDQDKGPSDADAKLAALNLEKRAPVARPRRPRNKGKRPTAAASDDPKPPPPPQPPPPTAGGAGTGTQQAVNSTANAAQQHYIQGNKYLQQRKVTLAIDEFKKSIKENPKNGLAYRSLGVAYYMLGRERSAMEAYSKFVRLAPTHKDVPKVKGLIADYKAKR